MPGMSPRRLFLLFISAIIFSILIYYTYSFLEVVPYIGLMVKTTTGVILEVYGEISPDQPLQVGDVIQQIDGQDWQFYVEDRSEMLFSGFKPGDKIKFLVQRDGKKHDVIWQVQGRNHDSVISRILTAPWPAYIFWVFGLLAIVAVGPTDTRWILTSLINNMFALWIAVGFVSWTHVYYSSIILHASSWLLAAMLIHFHTYFPRPFDGLNRIWLWICIYSIAILGAIGEIFQLMPEGVFYAVSYLGLVGSSLLLVLHAWRQKESRREVLLLAGVIVLMVLSIIGFQVIRAFSGLEWIGSGGVLLLPLFPGFYFLIALRQEVGGMAAIANRLISYLAFGLIAVFPVSLGLGLILNRPYHPEWQFLSLTIFVMLFGLAVIVSFPNFRSWFERRFLGVSIQSDEIVAAYAARLSACSDVEGVVGTLRNEVMPSLLVRQAALLRLENIEGQDGSQFLEPLCLLGISPEELPKAQDIPKLLAVAGRSSLISVTSVPWVRQVLTLKYKGSVIGMCLMGRRDPDDQYPAQELPFLQALMMQTALALVNVDQASLLRGLQREYIRRQDEEFHRLANDLHDEVLPQMALLARLVDSNNEQFGQAYFKASRRIRDVINGLRPDTLEHFGLKVALKELWVESKAYARETSTHIESELEGGLFRYPQDVEINLFRIVQQALNNALKHAQADRIEILGRLEESWLELSVVDDGVGFDAKGQDLLALLVRRNYGILTMYERANSIGAGLKIESTPGKGTCITVRWQVNGG